MEQEKNNTFSWVLRFATQCKGKNDSLCLTGGTWFCVRDCTLFCGFTDCDPDMRSKL